MATAGLLIIILFHLPGIIVAAKLDPWNSELDITQYNSTV